MMRCHLAKTDRQTCSSKLERPAVVRGLYEEKTMRIFGKTALALAISFGVAGSALAQAQSGGSMSSGAMSAKPAASGSMSRGWRWGSRTGSMNHDKMKGKKKDKGAMTSGSMSSGSMSSGSMNSQGH